MTEEVAGAQSETKSVEYKYDIAVSFAGEQRLYVEEVVRALNLPKDRVFYDADYRAEMWGEELTEVFTLLYRDEARYVVMFISREYAEKEWCILERRAALRRRMTTKGAYILPIRLDGTKLDEVEGLLGSIGDLDGLREGVAGVTDCLRQKLALALSEAKGGNKDGDDEQKFGQIVHDAAGLTALADERPHSWQWALFGSVLIQRREALGVELKDHALGFAPQSGERITDLPDLVQLVKNSMNDVQQNSFKLVKLVETPAFRAALGEPNDVADDPESILHVAHRVMDHYERFLHLARRVRGVASPSDYVDTLDSCARLSDLPMKGMNQFIDQYARVVAEMPQRLIDAGGENIIEQIALPLNMDNDLLETVLGQLQALIDEANNEDEDY
ncbi:TIR domain-containing protein [Mycolicibacterium vinylchloridicum]|uniref:TIR domain-containing protein n=1 Tax=Mycolicibacterium vinylchloridicum TaxID=2736928 RepID=UPI0015CD7152|nr:TIR domain-containing protein [Mycolicibacterium vinylchloridicum]